jgi:hypothetical protein
MKKIMLLLLAIIAKRMPWMIVMLASLLWYCSGCMVIKVPMVTNMEKFEIKEKIPIEAGLLITLETGSFIFRGRSDGLLNKGYLHEFPLGRELETASVQAFSQIFEKIALVRTASEAKNYRIIIEPRIEDFHFNFVSVHRSGSMITKVSNRSKIAVHMTLASSETILWEKSYESPWQEKGPTVTANINAVGEAAADAMADALKRLATDIINDQSLKGVLGSLL